MDDFVDASGEYVELPCKKILHVVKEWEDGTGLEIDQEFASKEAVWDLLNRASNENCFGVKAVKSDHVRLMVKYMQAAKGCNWYLLVEKVKKSEFWSVRVHRKMHTCSRSIESTSYIRQKCTPRLVVSVLHRDYPGKFDTPTPKNIMSLVQGRLGLSCSYSTTLRGRKQHVSDVRGSPETSYRMLFSYLHMLKEVNPGTVSSVELDEENRFKYLFIALGASIEGFSAMRKVIVIDATFLKTDYGGMLVIATAQDPNHHHYLIVFSVIDCEKNDSWNWFMRNLKTVIPDVPGLVFVSDRHASIIKAVMDIYPNALHANCVWHLSQNLRKHVSVDKDTAAEKFRDCAHCYTVVVFNKQYADFKSRFPDAAKFLEGRTTVEKWERCCFGGDKYNIDTSNEAESLNSVFRNTRKYHLLPMIDAIVEKISEWFNKHRKESTYASDTMQVVPYVENILHGRCQVAAKLSVTELNSLELEYSVIGLNRRTYLVDLKMKTCSCRCFDIGKYPCVHVIAAARKLMRNEWRAVDIHIYGLCSKYYLIETWVLAYYRTIYVVPHMSIWSCPIEGEAMFAKLPDYTPKDGRIQETLFPSEGEHRRKKVKNKATPGIDLERWLQPPSI